MENFKPTEWSASGVGNVSSVISKCKHSDQTNTSPEMCGGLKIYPKSAFFPIPFYIQNYLFSSGPVTLNKSLALIKDSIAMYGWNKQSRNIIIDKTKPKTVYGRIAEWNCPCVYGSAERYF